MEKIIITFASSSVENQLSLKSKIPDLLRNRGFVHIRQEHPIV
jgi:hypothetical protein